MSKLTVLDHTGDSNKEWDVATLDDPATAAIVTQAEQIVRDAFAKRSAVFVTAGGTETRAKTIDDVNLRSADEVLIVPQFVGG
jgi:hypothetical protein